MTLTMIIMMIVAVMTDGIINALIHPVGGLKDNEYEHCNARTEEMT